jgi:hypothetical protein
MLNVSVYVYKKSCSSTKSLDNNIPLQHEYLHLRFYFRFGFYA